LLGVADFRPEVFVQFGRAAPSWPEVVRVLGPDVPARDGYGHDGKEFWLLAHDPLLVHGEELVRRLDRPAYRAQRIVYPALAAPWRLLGERALLWGLLVTNLGVVAVGAYLAAALAVEVGAPPWAGLAFALNPATFVTVVHDGTDAVSTAALLASLLLLARARGAGATAAASLATLAKEASFMSLGGVALLWRPAARDWKLSSRVAYVGVPLALAAVWGVYARWRLGWPSTPLREFTPPFAGYVQAWGRGAPFAVLLLPLSAFILWLWRRRRSLLLAATVPFAAITPFLSANVLTYSTGALRALGPGVTLLAIELLRGRAGVSGRETAKPESSCASPA
jgi:hypothetical protein